MDNALDCNQEAEPSDETPNENDEEIVSPKRASIRTSDLDRRRMSSLRPAETKSFTKSLLDTILEIVDITKLEQIEEEEEELEATEAIEIWKQRRRLLSRSRCGTLWLGGITAPHSRAPSGTGR